MAHKKKNFIQHAVKHPGALTEAASRHGVSKREEAEKESHSSNPHIRARGNLGLRFMKGGDLHAKKKHGPHSAHAHTHMKYVEEKKK